MTRAAHVSARNPHLPHDSTEIASVPPPDARDDETARRNADRIVRELLRDHAAAQRPPRRQAAPQPRGQARQPDCSRRAEAAPRRESKPAQANPEAAVQAIVTGASGDNGAGDGPSSAGRAPDPGPDSLQAPGVAVAPEADIRAAITDGQGTGTGMAIGPRGRRAALFAGVAVAALVTALAVM